MYTQNVAFKNCCKVNNTAADKSKQQLNPSGARKVNKLDTVNRKRGNFHQVKKYNVSKLNQSFN